MHSVAIFCIGCRSPWFRARACCYHNTLCLLKVNTFCLQKKENIMIDTMGINRRFFACYNDKSRKDLEILFSVTHSTVSQWVLHTRQVPWAKLRYLVDEKHISWDWLIDGRGPKIRSDKRKSSTTHFNRKEISCRFLSLFANMSQSAIAKEIGVTQGAVSAWKLDRKPVPWEKLQYATQHKNVTWEWLLEGREPKHRRK